VQPKSQNTNLKTCLSCHRNLNYEFFGDSRTSKDGFNSYCRECRNQTRRIAYGKAIEELRFNLKDNNEMNLVKPFGANLEFSSEAICVTDWKIYQVNIQIKDYSGFYEIRDSNQNVPMRSEFFFEESDGDAILQKLRLYINENLSSRSLRLFNNAHDIESLRKY